jgi:hypothetical protein
MFCKDNAAINFISVQHRRVSFPSSLTDLTLLLVEDIIIWFSDYEQCTRSIMLKVNVKLYVFAHTTLYEREMGTKLISTHP